MSDDAIDETVRAFVLDAMARQQQRERDRVLRGFRRFLVLILVTAAVAGGCTAWLVGA